MLLLLPLALACQALLVLVLSLRTLASELVTKAIVKKHWSAAGRSRRARQPAAMADTLDAGQPLPGVRRDFPPTLDGRDSLFSVRPSELDSFAGSFPEMTAARAKVQSHTTTSRIWLACLHSFQGSFFSLY